MSAHRRQILPLFLLSAAIALAQDLSHVLPQPVPPQVGAPAKPAQPPAIELFAARAGEPLLAKRLQGVRLVTDPAQLADPGFPKPGLDASRAPALGSRAFAGVAALFLDRPVSRASLDRFVAAVRVFLQSSGRRFVAVYLPPQDITGGYVQIVVSAARAAAAVGVTGAQHFSAASYRAAVRQKPGEPIDEAQLDEDVAWLNRNPYRQVRVFAEPGAAAGTTRLGLLVNDVRPWTLTAGYDNTGTKATDENRVSAGLTWGNAFGRGDLLSYRFTSDPTTEHLLAHSLSYTAGLPWRHTLTLFGAWSRVESTLPEPFTQSGHSWQVGARYGVPLKPLRNGWTQNLTFSGDFKYTDNNLEFAAIPVTNNATHIVQAGATYGLGFRALGGLNSISFSGYASPGGLTARNHGRTFDRSRQGARADYVYGLLNFSHQHPLPGGWWWMTSGTAQIASGALLGSEQLNGGGSFGVRGYAESSAFGDGGVVVNNELHARAIPVAKGRGQLDAFAFVDVASLHLNVDRDSTDLRSAGVGANYQWSRAFTLRAAYGWQLKRLDNSTERARGHISAIVSW